MTVPAFLPYDLKKNDGVIVGCDHHQEWLIPWWWSKYAECNTYPVTFVDFGMSQKSRRFCQSHGEVLFVHDSMHFLAEKKDVAPQTVSLWESIYKAEVWNYRKSWFKKPFAMFLSPYQRSIWLDLDCEVVSSLEVLFETCHHPSKIALAREPENLQVLMRKQDLLFEKEVLYNSGVIVFESGAELIRKWIQRTLSDHSQFVGDQNLISRLIHQNPLGIFELPAIYNWRIFASNDPLQVVVHPQAVIIHWAHDWGKEHIRKYGGLSSNFRKLLVSFNNK